MQIHRAGRSAGVAGCFFLLLAGLACFPLAGNDWKDIAPSASLMDSMMLQRDAVLPLCGTGEPGQTVVVGFGGKSFEGVVAKDGTWTVMAGPFPASAENRTLTLNYRYPAGFDSPWDDLAFHDVLVGDIWLLSGQSNMEFGIQSAATGGEALADADLPAMRILLMPKAATPFPVKDLEAWWKPVNTETLMEGGWGGFSAIGFMFGRRIHRETGVPIGLVQAAFGGAPIQAFIPRDEFSTNKDLARDWRLMRKEDDKWTEALKSDPHAKHPWEGLTDYSRLKPSTCWNAMIAPLLPSRIKGVLWYQGEANVGSKQVYTTWMKGLIHGFREAFANPDLPFFFAQIAPWNYGGSLPSMWQSQFDALAVPGTGVALTVDVGDFKDIHPVRKQEVADRFVLHALAKAYGRKGIDPDGPVADGISREAGGLRVHFTHAAGLTVNDGKPVRCFQISAGADRNADYKDVPARLDGTDVVLSVPSGTDVKWVRYAWTDNPDVNLVDGDALPARPFSLKMEN